MTSAKSKPTIRSKTGYRIKRVRKGDSSTVLPHGISLQMTTMKNGRAKWTYTETFRADQFSSSAASKSATENTVAALRKHFDGSDMHVYAQGHGIVLTGTSTREDFSDAMVGEFLAWGGALGRVSLGQLLVIAARFLAAGWTP